MTPLRAGVVTTLPKPTARASRLLPALVALVEPQEAAVRRPELPAAMAAMAGY